MCYKDRFNLIFPLLLLLPPPRLILLFLPPPYPPLPLNIGVIKVLISVVPRQLWVVEDKEEEEKEE